MQKCKELEYESEIVQDLREWSTIVTTITIVAQFSQDIAKQWLIVFHIRA